jgi:hypothetical protein
MAKRQCTEEENALSDFNEGSVFLYGKLRTFFGKDYCKIGDLSKDDLISFLDHEDKLKRIDPYDFVEVSVTDLTSDRRMEIKVPIGEGTSSVMAIKKKVSEEFGVKVELHFLGDTEDSSEYGLKDSDILGHMDVNHDTKKFNLVVVESESSGVLEFSDSSFFPMNLDETSPVLYEMEPQGMTSFTVLANPEQVVVVDAPTAPNPFQPRPRHDALHRNSLMKAIFTNSFWPAKNYMDDGFDGVYSVSFALSLATNNVETPIPTLHEGCFFGMQSKAKGDGNFRHLWVIDAIHGMIFDHDRTVGMNRPGFTAGNVITMRLNCASRTLAIYRDGQKLGHYGVDADYFGRFEFIAYIPVAGFKITQVETPVLNRE